MFHAQHHPRKHHADSVGVGLGYFGVLDFTTDAAKAGVVEQDIKASEVAHGQVDHGADICL